MLLIWFLPYYFASNYTVPQFVTNAYITKGLLNMILDKQIIPPSRIGKRWNDWKTTQQKYVVNYA